MSELQFEFLELSDQFEHEVLKSSGITVKDHGDKPAVADPEGVHWVPWNPSFEELPLKMLCTYYVHDANTGATHFSFTLAITHVCQLNNFLYQEFDAHLDYVPV